MSRKPIQRRRRAQLDIEEATDYYLHEAGARVALTFADRAEDTLNAIGAAPRIGSPRYAHQLGVRGLRMRAIRGFPFLIFYVEQDDRVEVWRVLHARRDIASSLQDDHDAS